jgi:hypothetical protein
LLKTWAQRVPAEKPSKNELDESAARNENQGSVILYVAILVISPI